MLDGGRGMQEWLSSTCRFPPRARENYFVRWSERERERERENYFVWWNKRERIISFGGIRERERIISFGGMRERELLSHRNSTVVGESSTRCDDRRGGFVAELRGRYFFYSSAILLLPRQTRSKIWNQWQFDSISKFGERYISMDPKSSVIYYYDYWSRKGINSAF